MAMELPNSRTYRYRRTGIEQLEQAAIVGCCKEHPLAFLTHQLCRFKVCNDDDLSTYELLGRVVLSDSCYYLALP